MIGSIDTLSDAAPGGTANEPSGAISWAWGGLSPVAAANSSPAACGTVTDFWKEVGAPAWPGPGSRYR